MSLFKTVFYQLKIGINPAFFPGSSDLQVNMFGFLKTLFIYLFIYLSIYLFIYGCVGSSSLRAGFL